MPISESRYVNITSAVIGATGIPTRQLIGRFFTTNPLVPTKSHIEFSNADDVASYFGSGSDEYARAAFYFGWISKQGTRAPSISFAFWASSATAPLIYGAKGAQSVSSYTSISAGSFGLTMGAFSTTFTGINFTTGVTTLADVAAKIQTAIRAYSAGGANFTAATVTYDATRQSFNLVGGATGDAVISVTAGSGGNDIAGQLGWLSATAIFSNGSAVQSVTDVLSDSASNNNNFGSFTFMPSLTQNQVVEAATWNQTQNYKYIYSVRCTSSTASALSAALIGYTGTTLTLAPLANEYPEQIPMMVMAATDYSRVNAAQNYMFQQNFNVTPSVTNDTDANTYDALRVNYVGQTQAAGKFVAFYQRGYMMGGDNAAKDQNTYANEVWFKDDASAGILSLLLALPQIPANITGRAILLQALGDTIQRALINATISVGKTLTDAQKQAITVNSGDPRAWYQVQNTGYWVNAEIQSYTNPNSGVTEYKAVYIFIYSKSDAIRFVDGSDELV